MAEENMKHMPQFVRTGFLWQIEGGHVLVKQNRWGNNGKIRAVAKFFYDRKVIEEKKSLSELSNDELRQELRNAERTSEEIEMIRSELSYRRRLWVRQLSDEQLESKKDETGSQLQRDLINAESEYRKSRRDNNLPLEEVRRDEKLQDYKLTFVHEKRFKGFKTKNGARIVWPWESGIVLSTGTVTIITPAISEISRDKVRVTFDTNYMYHVADPELFAFRINQHRGVSGVERQIGVLLDNDVREYVKSVSADTFRDKGYKALKTLLRSKISEVEKDYGIELEDFTLSKIQLPNEILEREDELKAAEAESSRKIKLAKAEAEAAKIKAEADAYAARLSAEAQAYKDQKRLEAAIETVKTLGLPLDPNQLAAIMAATAADSNVVVNTSGDASKMDTTTAVVTSQQIGKVSQKQQQGQDQQPTQQQGQPQSTAPTAPTAPTTPTDGDEVSNDGKARTR